MKPGGRPATDLAALRPWRIALLVSGTIAISYLDRQTLPVAVSAIAKDIPLSNQQFSALQSTFLLSYALMYAGGGKLVDALGTRRGFLAIMIFWSLACASHALAMSASRWAWAKGAGSLRPHEPWRSGSLQPNVPRRWESSMPAPRWALSLHLRSSPSS